MTIDTTPDEYDYDGLSAAIEALSDQAIKDGADPQFVASRIGTASMESALKTGLSCTLKHILHTDQMAELHLKRFYDTYAHKYDLSALLKGEVVPK